MYKGTWNNGKGFKLLYPISFLELGFSIVKVQFLNTHDLHENSAQWGEVSHKYIGRAKNELGYFDLLIFFS